MADRPFESMSKSGAERRTDFGPWWGDYPDLARFTKCDRCGTPLAPGDWPFCKGNPKDHAR